MKSRFSAAIDDLRGSYWFIPALMAMCAVGLSFGVTYVDQHLDPAWIAEVSWLYGNKPDGARVLLSTVAGSMIGVAGVTFSVTIASVVYASGQYGPRLLTNFMRDQGNQVTLGTFIATFLYCILVLRTIRASDEAPASGEIPDGFVEAFVPHASLVLAIGMTVASIAVLIFFIHHVPDSIRVSHVIAGIGGELRGHIDEHYFPADIGRPKLTDMGRDRWHGWLDSAVGLASTRVGYVQAVDDDALLALAERHQIVLRLKARPGDFVASGDMLAMASPRENVTGDVQGELNAVYELGRARSGFQDVRFLFDELVEIAARALSPGVNDPFTAMTCVDWIGASLKQLADREEPEAERKGKDGVVRVVVMPTRFEDFVRLAFFKLEPYVASDSTATLHTLGTLAEIGAHVTRDERRAALQDATRRLGARALALSTIPHERKEIQRRVGKVQRLLRSDRFDVDTIGMDWVGGSA